MLNKEATDIAKLAIRSMLYEVCVTPKPGLVDRNNRGAHRDMDIFTFIDSSTALFETMYQLAFTGLNSGSKPLGEVFIASREIGLSGEEAMFRETRGVNTQKGLIFSIGIICTVAGILKANQESLSFEKISKLTKQMVQGIVGRELTQLSNVVELGKEPTLTAGQQIYLKYGVGGIREEVAQGFSKVGSDGLPNLRKYLEQGMTMNDALVNTLLHLIAVVEDTNILWRGGPEALAYARATAQEAIELGGMATIEGQKAITAMDLAFKARNISGGGCADLLAVTLMFYFLEN